jgi:hypothetical protein
LRFIFKLVFINGGEHEENNHVGHGFGDDAWWGGMMAEMTGMEIMTGIKGNKNNVR